ncbi:aromatic amino acid lyase [Kiloniella sp.]|uniref:aromatic amino acid lyase n=1 Tax=Kiloniella sp. TaxID=1938587 RepID=UPI003B02B2C6
MSVANNPLILDGETLDPGSLIHAAVSNRPVILSEEAWSRISVSRGIVDGIVESGQAAYGVTTWVGSQKDFAVSSEAVSTYNERLIKAHATRVPGPTLKPETVRAALIYMVNAYGRGFSGVSEDLVRLLLKRINTGEMPEIDASGSVGASDLVPLAQIAHWLLSSDEAKALGLPRAKEALSLINSNAISLACGAEQLVEAEKLLTTFDLSAAIALEGFRGNLTALSEQANAAHRRKGQAKSAKAMRDVLSNSVLWQAGEPRFLQDPLSFRCASQVHGATWEVLTHAMSVWTVELNTVHDNPIIDVDSHSAVSHGNMDSTGMTLAIDRLRQALAKVCDLSGERLHKQQWTAFSGLPTGLSEEGSAVGGVQFLNLGHIAASLIASAKIWAPPHLLISVGQLADGVEDTAGYALHAVHDLSRLVDAAWKIVAVELIISVWAILRRRVEMQSLGEGVRPIVVRLRPMLPIQTEGEEVFRLAPIMDFVRGGELMSSSY